MDIETSKPPKSRFDIKNLTKKQKIIIASVSSAVILFIVIGIVVAVTGKECKYNLCIVSSWYENEKFFSDCHCKIDGTIGLDQGCPKDFGACQCKKHVRGDVCQMCEKGFTGYPNCDESK